MEGGLEVVHTGESTAFHLAVM
ncbi:hypothetical protein LINPERPRIM_LOCUS13663 [Linum perenne]